MRFLICVILFAAVSACGFMNQDFENYGKNYQKINLHLLTIGDEKKQVVLKIGDPINVIGSKKFPNGVVEVWAYERWNAVIGLDKKEEEYWLYFFNDHLEQWGRPGDWSQEADRIYEVRFR